MTEPTTTQEKEGPGFPAAFLIGLSIVAVLLAAVWLISSREAKEAAPVPLAWGEPEKAYAPRIRFTEIQMSRAANFLGQEVTIIAGFVENVGNQTILEMECAVEFRDFSDQPVFRDTVRLFGKQVPPLDAGRRRDFQFNFEKVPGSWNQQHPRFHITGLSLQP